MKYSWKQIASMVLLIFSVHYLMQIFAFDLYHQIIPQYGLTYFLMFYLPKILPIIIMGLYYFADFKFPTINKALDLFSWLTLLLAIATGTILLLGWLLQWPLSTFFGEHYTWSYEAPLEWVLCFVVCWIIVKAKTASSIGALAYASQAIFAGGNLHEFLFGLFNADNYFHTTYPFFVATSFVSLVFLFLLMYDNRWVKTRVFLVAFASYVVFTVFYVVVFNPNVASAPHLPNMWLPRLPTIFMLIAVPLGFRLVGDGSFFPEWLLAKTVKFRHGLARRLAPKVFALSLPVSDMLAVTPRPMILFLKDYFADKKELVGLEIGVAGGENALSILKTLRVKKLYLVDPFAPYFENGVVVSYSHLYREALRNLGCFSQVVFVKKFSVDAVGDVAGGLDFVYVDGNHDYEFVKNDIAAYFRKVRVGGVIGGHDYTPINAGNVVRAVNEFVDGHDRRNFYAVFPDWWYVKR